MRSNSLNHSAFRIYASMIWNPIHPYWTVWGMFRGGKQHTCTNIFISVNTATQFLATNFLDTFCLSVRFLLRSLREVAVVLLGPPPWWIHSFCRRDGVLFAISCCSSSLCHTLLWVQGSSLSNWPPNGQFTSSSVVVALLAQLAEEIQHWFIGPNFIGFYRHSCCSVGTIFVPSWAISNESYEYRTPHQPKATQSCHSSLLIHLMMRRLNIWSQCHWPPAQQLFHWSFSGVVGELLPLFPVKSDMMLRLNTPMTFSSQDLPMLQEPFRRHYTLSSLSAKPCAIRRVRKVRVCTAIPRLPTPGDVPVRIRDYKVDAW